MIIGQNSGHTQKVQKKNFTVVRGDTFTYQFDDEFITYVNEVPYTVDLSQCTIVGHIKKNKGDEFPFQFMDFSISEDNQLILHLPTSLTKLFEAKKYYYDVELIIDTTQTDSIPYGTNEDETTGEYEEIVEIGEGGESGYTKPVIGGIPRHVTILSGYIKFVGDVTLLDLIEKFFGFTFGWLNKFKLLPLVKINPTAYTFSMKHSFKKLIAILVSKNIIFSVRNFYKKLLVKSTSKIITFGLSNQYKELSKEITSLTITMGQTNRYTYTKYIP